jgi:DNA polymerase
MQGLLFEEGELEPRASTTTKPLYRDLSELYERSRGCTQCRLASTRTRFVFGEGNPQARLVVIGEAPGADEDAQGRPFVGRSGQLLDKILLAVGFRREEVFICNILKCRPPQNRNPLQDEIEHCLPWLAAQLELINPDMLLLLGRVAANTLLDNTLSMGAMRGKVMRWNHFDCVVTYHPAALLRNPNWKRGCWEDVQMMRRHYDALQHMKNNP